MSRTTTRTKVDPYAVFLAEREAAAIEKASNVQESLATEDGKALALEAAVETTRAALEDIEDRARAGDPDVTGLALAEARADHEVAQMGYTGATQRAKRLGDFLDKQSHDKAVAEIVRDALVSHMLPGANAYATFRTGGFAQDSDKPDNLPALVVEQIDGGIGDDGIGQAELHITWHRGALHAPLDADRLRAALEAAGFWIDRSGLNEGVTVWPAPDRDTATIRLRNVTETVPVVARLASDVDGWDFALAQAITSKVQWLAVEGVGASIVDSQTSGDLVQTRVRVTLAGRTDIYADRDPHGPSFSGIVRDQMRREVVETVKAGLGRCVGVEQVDVPDSPGLGRLLGNGYAVAAVEFTFTARTPA